MLLALLRSHWRPYSRPIALVLVLQLVQTLATLSLPALNAEIIDQGVIPGDIGLILHTGGVMIAITLVQVVCAIGAVYFGAQAAMGLGRDIRASIFDRVQSFSAREVNQFGAPSLITRTTNDVQQVQMLVLMTFTMMIAAPIMCIGGIVLAVRQDSVLALLIFLIVPLLIGLVAIIISRMRPLFRSMQGRIDSVNRVMREQIAGIRVVRAFVREEYEQKRFRESNAGLRDVSIGVGRLMALMPATVMLVINASSVAVIWFGGHRIDNGAMQVGDLIAFLSYLMQILMAVMMATFMFVMLPRAEVCADRIMEVVDTDSSVVPPADPIRTLPGYGRLELRDVDFRFPGAESSVLDDVTLIAEPGQTTAVIGSTGSGKTTLLSLIPRLMDPTDGQVLIDGVDVRDVDPALLVRTVGLVPQKPYLFTGTVASNLRYGKPEATDAELWDALETAQARDFVAAMTGGLDAPIAQGGTNVSGGQRQRLAIARVLVRRPQIYLFDDSFSALDYATDAALRAALARATDNATVLIVAQRVSTIRDANRIVVLDEGAVVGLGTHSELMASNETYREIVLSQLTEVEAA